MQTRKISFIPGLLMGILFLLVIMNLGKNTNPTAPASQSVMQGGSSRTTGQGYDQSITVNSSTFNPQFTGGLPAELTDGSQWILAYWWENHEMNAQGLGVDWGFFTPVAGNSQTILLAKCHDPTWTNPTPGKTIYTYIAANGWLEVPGNSELQRFIPADTVVNPGAANAISTQMPAVPTQQFALPTATYVPPAEGTQQSLLPGTFTTPTPIVVTTSEKPNHARNILLLLGGFFLTLITIGVIVVYRMYKEAHPS